MEKLNIVGFGIAGASFAWTCYFNQIDFKIVDSGLESSSHVAAGLVNPIVFKRLTKSWNADIFMPFAKDFYAQIEQELGEQIISHKSIIRIFGSVEEENNWSALEGDGRFTDYLQSKIDFNHPDIQSPYGAGAIKTIGHLNTRDFLNFSKLFFKSKGIQFSKSLSESPNEKIIYCEGSAVLGNPYFNYLPIRPTHGDVLTIKAESLQINDIVNKNMFVLPLGNHLYKIGATYNWELTTNEPSLHGKNELIEKLNAFTNFDFEVVKHEAGLRPTVSDRRPLLGQHPQEKNRYIFNGLGTKGVMIAPFYAQHLLNHINSGASIDEEVSIERHFKHYNA